MFSEWYICFLISFLEIMKRPSDMMCCAIDRYCQSNAKKRAEDTLRGTGNNGVTWLFISIIIYKNDIELLVIILIEQQGLTKAVMASRMNTSRSALDRLLDPDNDSVTLKTLQNAASTIGAHLEMKLVFNKEAAWDKQGPKKGPQKIGNKHELSYQRLEYLWKTGLPEPA